jgi:hypothetical protein
MQIQESLCENSKNTKMHATKKLKRPPDTLHQLMGVCLVAATISAYRDAWLFALSVVLDVEVVWLHLTDRSREAAFALALVIQGDKEPDKTPQEEHVAGTAPAEGE